MFGRLMPEKSAIAKHEALGAADNARILRETAERLEQVPMAKSPKAKHGKLVKGAKKAPSACNNPGEVRSSCLRQLYNTYDYVPKATSQNSLALTGYLAEYASYSDLAMFLRAQRPDQANYKFKSVGVAGGENPQGYSPDQVAKGSGIEANLDVQTAAGITGQRHLFLLLQFGADSSRPQLPPRTFSTRPPAALPSAQIVSSVQLLSKDSLIKRAESTPSNTNEPYLVWLQYMLDQSASSLPKVVSTSCKLVLQPLLLPDC